MKICLESEFFIAAQISLLDPDSDPGDDLNTDPVRIQTWNTVYVQKNKA